MAVRSADAEEEPLAIKGYDPVAYFTDGKPTPGLPEIEYEWDEHRYRFCERRASRSFQGRSRALRAAIRKFLRHGAGEGEDRRGQPGELADQRRQALFSASRRPTDRRCSRKTLSATSPRRTRTGRSFRSTSGQSVDGGRPPGVEAGLAQSVAQLLEIGGA